MKGLQGKVAVVTGGSSGIGQGIAIRLGEEGVDVAINYVGRPEGAEETKDAIEHGVDICMKQMAEAGTAPQRFPTRWCWRRGWSSTRCTAATGSGADRRWTSCGWTCRTCSGVRRRTSTRRLRRLEQPGRPRTRL